MGHGSHWCDQHAPHVTIAPRMTRDEAVAAAEELLRLSRATDELIALSGYGGTMRTKRAEELLAWVKRAW